jgi:hypothetical protein
VHAQCQNCRKMQILSLQLHFPGLISRRRHPARESARPSVKILTRRNRSLDAFHIRLLWNYPDDRMASEIHPGAGRELDCASPSFPVDPEIAKRPSPGFAMRRSSALAQSRGDVTKITIRAFALIGDCSVDCDRSRLGKAATQRRDCPNKNEGHA